MKAISGRRPMTSHAYTRKLLASSVQLARVYALLFAMAYMVAGQASVAAITVAGSTAAPQASAACGQVPAGYVRCLAMISTGLKNSAAGTPASLPSGYGPAEFHTAYQLPCTPGGSVASTCSAPGSYGPNTIAIVVAGGFSSGSSLESALQTYDTTYSLPACTAANGCLDVVNQSGSTSSLPPNLGSGWSDEMALDTETAHMVCQTCKIVVVMADDNTVGNLAAAEVTAASFNPDVISNSWGATSDISSYDSSFTHQGIAVIASTGDNGTVTGGQMWPADIPDVVAASGTNLQLNSNNTWAGETVWSGSGGGCSTNYSAPAWQTGLSNWAANGCSGGGRAFGDLSADADPNTGAAVYDGSGWRVIGGTSLAAPLLAGMYALAGGIPANTYAPADLYNNYAMDSSAYHDVTSGNDCTGSGQSNCTAGTGFDEPSGIGSPAGMSAFSTDPTPPSNLTASYVSQSQLNLGWSAATASNGVKQYNVYRNGAAAGTTTALSFADTGLTANTSYAYYLTTTDTLGNVSVATPTVTIGTFLAPDINEDGHINLLDFSLLASKYGQSGSGIGRSDINGDGTVNLLDFSLLASKYGSE